MPVEIKELIIRAVVSGAGDHSSPQPDQQDPEIERERLIETCVQRVLAVIARKSER